MKTRIASKRVNVRAERAERGQYRFAMMIAINMSAQKLAGTDLIMLAGFVNNSTYRLVVRSESNSPMESQWQVDRHFPLWLGSEPGQPVNSGHVRFGSGKGCELGPNAES